MRHGGTEGRRHEGTEAAVGAGAAAGAIHWTRPQGGLYVWVTLPESVDTSREAPLFAHCVDRGVLYVPGAYSFHVDVQGRVPRHHMRLCYGQVPLQDIKPGIARLAEAIRAVGRQ